MAVLADIRCAAQTVRSAGFLLVALLGCTPAAVAGPLSWTDLADLALASPVVLSAMIRKADRLGRKDAPDVAAGEARVLVRADLVAALKAPTLLPAGAAWIWQGPVDARGRPPFGKAAPVMVFAALLSGGGDPAVQALRLVSPHGQQPFTAQSEAAVRDILSQAIRPGAGGLMVTGVSDGFRSAGDIADSSESQFFLATEGGKPMTLIVRRAPGTAAIVRVATDEFVDRAAPVQPSTLLWRGLACGLPDALPPRLAENPELAADYALARESIGLCGRTVSPPR